MVRPASQIGKKWESAFQNAAEDASEAYGNALPKIPQAIINAKSTAKTNFAKALDASSYDASVRAGLAPGIADVAYSERLAQIEENGFTASQRAKMVAETEIRRHLSSLISAIITAADGSSGNLKFPAGLSLSLRRQIVNVALMQLRDNFSTTTTSQAAIAVIKSNIANVANLTVAA